MSPLEFMQRLATLMAGWRLHMSRTACRSRILSVECPLWVFVQHRSCLLAVVVGGQR
jgi:hypothetical protein